MIILDIPRRFSGAYVEVPTYHRAHLSLAPEAQVHLCLLPRHMSATNSRGSVPLPELIVSPIDLNHWTSIWRLTVFLRERPGLVHDVYDTLMRHGINVLAAESTNMEEQQLHYVEMIIDVEDAADHERPAESAARRVERVEWSILARLFDDIVFAADGLPRLKIRPVQNLWHAKSVYLRELANYEEGLPFKPLADTARARLSQPSGEGRHLRIPLPKSMREAIARVTAVEREGHHTDYGYHLRVSDTKDRFLRVFFFRTSDAVIHARIEHTEQRGALATITGALRDHGFDILTSFSSLYEHKKRATFEVVVRAPALHGKSAEALKAYLESALQSPHCLDYELEVGYPRNYGPQWSKKRLEPRPPQLDFRERPDIEAENDTANSLANMYSGLQARFDEFVRRIQGGSLLGVDQAKWTLVNRLLTQFRRWSSSAHSKALFVSCQFKNPNLFGAVRQAAECADLKFTVVTGENLVGFPTKIEGLINRIGSCTHYLGVWSIEGAERLGEQYWPSPWLLWEWGVACALGLKWRLLISKAISTESWSKIRHDQQHEIFSEQDFETRLRSVLTNLANL